MRVATVVGARPQFVKAAAVSRAVREQGLFDELIIHTGQHYDETMSKLFFDELGIPEPDFNLEVGSGPHGAQTGRMLERLEQVLMRTDPALVLVYGDTNSTLAGALAAAKLHIPVAHVEAGLRSFNRRMPEEINRIVTDHVSDLLFTPTETASSQLLREGISADQIVNAGDVMFDVVIAFRELATRSSTILERLGLTSGSYGLATVHRAENTDDRARLATIVRGLAEFATDLPVVLPLHPRARQLVNEDTTIRADAERLMVIDPVGYLDMTVLEQHAAVIATDSGGVQKEAFFHGVPCVTLRDETEWTELVSLGWNRLCPPTTAHAVRDALRAARGTSGDRDARPYGDGRAAHTIVRRIDEFLRGAS